jgi:type 1 glutamine amidotransferase
MKAFVRAFVALLVLAPVLSASQEKKKYKVLALTQSKGFKHGPVSRKSPQDLCLAEATVSQIGKDSGLFETECTQDASAITAEKLKEVDVLFFYTTGDDLISPAAWAAIDEWLKSGKAFVGTHSSTDTMKNHKGYYEMINGSFNGHPWGGGETVTLTNHDPGHATVKMLGPEFQWKDEIYQYSHYDPKAVRVLYSLNMAKCKVRMPYHVPVCWVREYGQGRLFYTNLGHNESTWTNAKFKEHLLAGIRWALKLEEGPATPNPEVQALENTKSMVAALVAETGKKDEEIVAAVDKVAAADSAARDKLVGELAEYRKDQAELQNRFKREQAELQKKLGKILGESK